MKFNFKNIQHLLKPLIRLPIHPQWLSTSCGPLKNILAVIQPDATVLDLGCNDMWPKSNLASACKYIGADYPDTATNWYKNKPEIYLDAHSLPFDSGCVNWVLLLDVLEHLEDPLKALCEIARVLTPEGSLIVKIPFMYPLHDQPRDFFRITPHGMFTLAEKSGLKIEQTYPLGSDIETAALLKNISYSALMIKCLKNGNPLALLIPILPIYILLQNLLSYAISRISGSSNLMPHGYLFVFHKR